MLRAAYLPTQTCPKSTVFALSIQVIVAAVGVNGGGQQHEQIGEDSYVNRSQRLPLW